MPTRKLSFKESKTINYYDKHAQEWKVKHKQSGNFGRLSPEFKLFLKLLPKGKVIEIGTGTGEDAINLIKKYGIGNYVGLEPAKGLMEIAIENNPGAKFLNKSIYEIDFPKNTFDGFWLCQMLIHIPKNRINIALNLVNNILKPKSIGMISILEGNNTEMEESRPGRYYSLWNDEEFSNVLKKNGFEIVHKRKLETGFSPWLIYVLRKVVN